MDAQIQVQPLPRKTRQLTLGFLVVVFMIAIPFLYMYATGYRLDFKKPTNLVSTGGISITVEQADSEIYIDDELVRTARIFSKAFYAQGLDIGTHRIYVKKDGYHTWVKELPVSKRLVTEAEAFNVPLVPQVRVISEWQSATGSAVLPALITHASTTNNVIATTTTATTTFSLNTEFESLRIKFASTTEEKTESRAQQLRDLLRKKATTTEEMEEATTTITSGGVRLARSGKDLFAAWVGPFEEMPYYFCAPDFPRYSTTTEIVMEMIPEEVEDGAPEMEMLIHPIQTIPVNTECEPSIRIDRKLQEIHDFDFLPGTTDFVILVLGDGIYVVEVDDRSWQNTQPLMLGTNLRLHIENGGIFVYDGKLIYEILLTSE